MQAANVPAEEAIRVTIEENDPDDLADITDLSELPEPEPALSDADYKGCRWIEGATTPIRSGMYCCRPTRPRTSWCPEHHRIAFGRTARKRDAA
jgi:hypothetical protein